MGTFPAVFVLVMVKEPVPGRVKTRLCPPCSPEEAAAIAEAAITDTLAAACGSGTDEVIVALDGSPGPWLPSGVRVVPQIDGSFDRRLAAAWDATSGPGVQIGMDTPQLTSTDLDGAMHASVTPEVDAVLGPAVDGGWWLIGLPEADVRVFVDVPMSTDETGTRQLERLRSLGHRVRVLERRLDVDHFDDATTVAETAPTTRFAATVRQIANRSGTERRAPGHDLSLIHI